MDLPGQGASAVAQAAAKIPAAVGTTLGEVVDKLDALASSVGELISGQSNHDERITAAEAEIAVLKAQLAKVNAPRQQAAIPRRPAPVRPPRPAPPQHAPDEAAELLSVDVWDGKPSVVVGRSREGTRDVRFLNEGDTQGRVTVKRADVDSQRALLSSDNGEFVMSRAKE